MPLELSDDANRRLDGLRDELPALIHDHAQRLAVSRNLDEVSETHIEEALVHLMQGTARPGPWRAWSGEIGGLCVGGALGGLYSEFRQPNRADWNLIIIVALIALALFGLALMRFGKR